MGYLHIDNLYKNQKILMWRECYAMEKVHGTSAHVNLVRVHVLDPVNETESVRCDLNFFSGGANHMQFTMLFDHEALKKAFLEMGGAELTVYGEAYGGKMQGMRETYGPELRFIAFDVLTKDRWSDVPSAEFLCTKLGFEFVPYERVSTDLATLDAQRDLPSRVAVRRGITEPKISEGVVLRPIVEVYYNNGGRFIAKHKRPEFSERASKRDTVVDSGQLQVLEKADAIVLEWVTPTRLEHVLDKLAGILGRPASTEDTRAVIDAMVEDVTREAKDEIVASKEAIRAISTATGKLFIGRLRATLK